MVDQLDATWEALADGNKNITLTVGMQLPLSAPYMVALQTIYSIYPNFRAAYCLN